MNFDAVIQHSHSLAAVWQQIAEGAMHAVPGIAQFKDPLSGTRLVEGMDWERRAMSPQVEQDLRRFHPETRT